MRKILMVLLFVVPFLGLAINLTAKPVLEFDFDGDKEQITIPNNTSLPGTLDSLRPGQIWTDPVTGMEFVWVPTGCYLMGDDYGLDKEKPVHRVCLDGFWMGKYEVTQRQWEKIMGSNPSRYKSGDDFPVENISWDDTKKFISELNKHSVDIFKLPTEAEWEYAARSGGKDRRYTGGHSGDNVFWYGRNNQMKKPHKVGDKQSKWALLSFNSIGIYNMTDNVYEWCEDIYDKNSYSKHGKNNTLVKLGGVFRVVRGGSLYHKRVDLRAYRSSGPYTVASKYIGVRLVRIVSDRQNISQGQSFNIVSNHKVDNTPRIIATDGHYEKYETGTVYDKKRDLMWASEDNGYHINWNDAMRYCEDYQGGGFTDWRMPTLDELKSLYDRSKSYKVYGAKAHLTELIRLSTPWPWSSESNGSGAAFFSFTNSRISWPSKSSTTSVRVLPVRSGK